MRLMLLATITLLALTACSSSPAFQPEPIQYTPHKLKNCGAFSYEIKDGKMILDEKTAKCLQKNLVVCCKDKKALQTANEANIRIINILERDIFGGL